MISTFVENICQKQAVAEGIPAQGTCTLCGFGPCPLIGNNDDDILTVTETKKEKDENA